ncbi:hypothetical protein FH972_008467 [Carpinus fangiana]|uniref:Uncharacterized protein n=1 Tax=Carpinus fangiana TaxID=176857 RepID=A0A5N6R1L0_9ROSI|nr:hypothetical protein FH972_008467 [Carpinus fangiana]
MPTPPTWLRQAHTAQIRYPRPAHRPPSSPSLLRLKNQKKPIPPLLLRPRCDGREFDEEGDSFVYPRRNWWLRRSGKPAMWWIGVAAPATPRPRGGPHGHSQATGWPVRPQI